MSRRRRDKSEAVDMGQGLPDQEFQEVEAQEPEFPSGAATGEPQLEDESDEDYNARTVQNGPPPVPRKGA